MDSARESRPSPYNSIPEGSTGHATTGNGIRNHVSRISRPSFSSRLLKTVTVITVIVASVFLLSSPCISCDLFTMKHRLTNLAIQQKQVIPSYSRAAFPYVERNQAYGTYLPVSQSLHPRKALSRYYSPSLATRASQLLEDSDVDYVLVERVGTRDCTGGLGCAATVVVIKEGGKVTIQAGYIIRSFGEGPRMVTELTRKRISRVTPLEASTWAQQLFSKIDHELEEVGCTVTPLMIAEAVFFTSSAAAHCPKTDDPACNELLTIEECYLPGAAPKDSCQTAFDECEFTFYGESGLTTFGIGGYPDKSFTPVIVAKDPNVHLGVLNSNNIVPEFIDDDGAYPITDFGSQRFAPTQFKPYYIGEAQGSGIGHQTFHGDQEEVAKGRCIRIFFTAIQLLNPTSNLNHVPKSENKCVVFRTV